MLGFGLNDRRGNLSGFGKGCTARTGERNTASSAMVGG